MSLSNNNFFSILTALTNFWSKMNCVLIPPAQTEISSPMFHPNVFFSMLNNNKDFNIMYFQPYTLSKENVDSRYDMKTYSFLKFQVIIKSNLELPQKVFLDSLKILNFDLQNNKIRFKNEKFDSFVFRLNATGYKVYLNETPIAILYYMQNLGQGQNQDNPIVISYNLDNIAMLLQNCNNIWDIKWSNDSCKNIVTYGDITLDLEKDGYNFINNNLNKHDLIEIFNLLINMAKKLLIEKTAISAYIYAIRAKYYLDIIDYKNFLTQESKIKYNKILREVIDNCCKEYLINKKI